MAAASLLNLPISPQTLNWLLETLTYFGIPLVKKLNFSNLQLSLKH